MYQSTRVLNPGQVMLVESRRNATLNGAAPEYLWWMCCTVVHVLYSIFYVHRYLHCTYNLPILRGEMVVSAEGAQTRRDIYKLCNYNIQM